jgi:hypothetical protein
MRFTLTTIISFAFVLGISAAASTLPERSSSDTLSDSAQFAKTSLNRLQWDVPKGTRLRVATLGGDIFKGKLLRIAPDSVVLKADHGEIVSVRRTEVHSIARYKRGESGPILLGGLLGIFAGVAIYAVISNREANSDHNTRNQTDPWSKNVWIIPLNGLLGAILGASSESVCARWKRDDFWKMVPTTTGSVPVSTGIGLTLTVHF